MWEGSSGQSGRVVLFAASGRGKLGKSNAASLLKYSCATWETWDQNYAIYQQIYLPSEHALLSYVIGLVMT